MDINLTDKTIELLIQAGLRNLGSPEETPTVWRIGANYCVRTVTMIFTGELVAVTKDEIILKKAAWIADTGRFGKFLEDTTSAEEVEVYPQDREVLVGRGALVDACEIDILPSETK